MNIFIRMDTMCIISLPFEDSFSKVEISYIKKA